MTASTRTETQHTIDIVDRGRGPQLSTGRITVQDLVPYFQRGCTYEEIREVVPVLTVEEIAAVERYIRDHHDEVMEQDRRIRERAAARRPSAEIEEAERQARLERLDQARKTIREQRGQSGDRDPR